MIRLRIDGRDVPVDQKSNIAITAGIAEIEEPENSSSGYSKSVEVPFTPQSMEVFGFVNELYSKEQFNNALHTAEYVEDDTVVLSGIAQIEKITYSPGAQGQTLGGAFHVSVIGASFDWITNAKKPVNELPNEEGLIYTLQNVYDRSVSWALNLIKFFPVDRGAFWTETADNEQIPRRRLDILDYHPFINVWSLLLLIFKGYTLRSSFDPFFRLLHISGSFPETKDLSYIKEENDFKIGTTQDDQLEFSDGDLINIFDNRDGDGFTANGVIAPGTRTIPYSAFNPKNKLTMRFKIELTYFAKSLSDSSSGYKTTDYADTFRFGVDYNDPQKYLDEFHFPVEKSTEYADRTYDTDDVDYHGVYYIRLTLPKGAYSDIQQVDGGSSFSSKYIPGKWLGFYHITNGRGTYQLFAGNQVDGEVATWVNVKDIRGAKVEVVSALSGGLSFSETLYTTPRTFDQETYLPLISTFYNSELPDYKKTTIRVGAECTLSPVIGNYIGIGDKVDIASVGGETPQINFLSALRQMYNLMFYTNPVSREVFIEPRTEFFNMDRADILDWRYKIDYSKPVEVQELGGDVGNALRLSFADGGEVVQRYNWKNRTDLGSWRTPLLNKTSDEVKEIVNPIFAPFLVRNVPSVGMILPQNESEKTQEQIEDTELDITPIVGCFAGVVDRTAGDDLAQWPKYPRLAFQDAGLNINLGFGDLPMTSSTVPGLHQYYEDNISAYNHGRRITLYLHLEAQDVEAMQTPNSIRYDMRAVFLLCVDGEDVPCLLEKIEDYKPGSGASTKCQFISDPHIRLTGKEMVVITYDNEAITYRNKAVAYRQEPKS